MGSRDDKLLGSVAASLLAQLRSANTRTVYSKALDDFLEWCNAQGEATIDDTVVKRHLQSLGDAGYAPATINQRLAAIRKLVCKGGECGLVESSAITAISRIAGAGKRKAARKPVLSAAAAETLINAPSPTTTKGIRDRALLAVLLGCGLRRPELVKLTITDVQSRSPRWILANVIDTRGRPRTISIPAWAKEAILGWLHQARLKNGPLFPSISRSGTISSRAITVQSVLSIVANYGKLVGLAVTPEDLRRTCAALCREAGGDLDQIRLLLGHASIETTERLLGGARKPIDTPNIRVRMTWHNRKKMAS